MAVAAETSLTNAESAAVVRFVELARERLGGQLDAIWLYGSRARGEPPKPESDVDLMVLAEGGEQTHSSTLVDLAMQAEREAGGRVWLSALAGDRAWLARRREIRDFFIAEVDRDKVVLLGEP